MYPVRLKPGESTMVHEEEPISESLQIAVEAEIPSLASREGSFAIRAAIHDTTSSSRDAG